jgi:hypothetical protein
MTFMLGTHQPQFVEAPGTESVTWFISRERIKGRDSWPRVLGEWCQDSGGFTMLDKRKGWTISDRRLANETRLYVGEMGNFRWASPRDWMCEPHILRNTGKTIAEHQELTIDSCTATCSRCLLPVARIRRRWRGVSSSSKRAPTGV